MRKLIVCLSVVLSLLAANVQANNLLVDGSFDLATSGSQTSGSPWVLTVNFPDGSDPSARFQTGFGNSENNSTQSPGTGAGIWFRAFEGDQGGVGDPLGQASITQSLVAPVDGDYTLNFRAAIEGIIGVGEFSVTLSSSGGASDTVDLIAAQTSVPIPSGNIGGGASANLGGTPFALSISGVLAGETISVSGDMIDSIDTGLNPQSAFLDRFNLVVPEPTSIVLTSMGLIGMLAFRRKR